jgi:glycosyltransferase involved in cell wall biosynthesis
MHLAIDASNIRQGGGITHLSQLLSVAKPHEAGISQVTVWACKETTSQLPTKQWLTKLSPPWTEAGMLRRFWGQQIQLGQEMSQRGCDALFSPGGTVPLFRYFPVVTMSQNMLPFEPEEAIRFGSWSWMHLKMWLLRQSQGRSFRNADGLIFLTQYARNRISAILENIKGMQAKIPHGIEPRFAAQPKHQRPIHDYSLKEPFTFLYVSILMPYKHQIKVAEAVSMLRTAGSPIQIKFVGSAWGHYGQEFRKTLRQLDPLEEFLIWSGEMPFSDLHHEYQKADAFVFASSCENLPNILIEAMTAGLPIACSTSGPMPEVLGSAGVYFDPLQPQDIAIAMRTLMQDADIRTGLAAQAKALSQEYSWQQCAKDTFEFIAAVAARHKATSDAETSDYV